MNKPSLAVFVLLLSFLATKGQPLTYRLLSDSTITPSSTGGPTGPAQPLTGTFTWVPQTPSGIIGSDEFNITALNFSSTSYTLTLANSSQPDNITKIGAQGGTELNAEIIWSGSTTNPWYIGAYGSGTFTGPADAPTRLIFNQEGFYSTDGPYAARLFIDAQLVGGVISLYPVVLNFTATAQMQQPTNSLPGGSTIPAPAKSGIDTKQVLAWLAQDEYAAGHYGYTNFPAGAQLTSVPNDPILIGQNIVLRPGTQVLDQNGYLITDTSDILSYQDGDNPVFSGKLRPENAGFNPTGKELHFIRVNYDDSQITNGLGLQFDLQGLMTTTFNDSKPTVINTFTRVTTGSSSSAAGDGSLNGIPFVLTGSINTQQKIVMEY